MDFQPRRCLLRNPRASRHGGKPWHARGLQNTVVILILAAGLGLATGSPNAGGAEGETEESDAERTGLHEARQRPPNVRRRPSLSRVQQRQRQWWTHAREVLFTDLELSAEQADEVDGIVEAQLRTRARFHQRDADWKAARQQGDRERSAAIRAELRTIDAQLKDPHELFEEMRALLTEEQRPTFDTNRARLVAETRAARETSRGGRAQRPERRLKREIE